MLTALQMLVLLVTLNCVNRLIRGSTTSMENVSGANVCTYNIQYPIVTEVSVTVRQSVKRRCNIGSITDILRGKCVGNKYVTAYRSVAVRRNETRVIIRTERRCCNGTSQVDGVCIKEQAPVTTQYVSVTSQSSNGSLVPILVVVTVLAVVGVALAVCVYRRKNIYSTPQGPKQLGIVNAVYNMEKGLYVRSTAKVIYGREKLRKKEKPDKSSSHHTYVLPDDPSYLKLDSRREHSTQNVYESIPSSKAQPTADDRSYETLNREKMTMSQNVYDKMYTQLSQSKK